MRVLVTSSRMPFALDLIRKLGGEGLEVLASDTFAVAPGSHSSYASKYLTTASPRFDTLGFIADLRRFIVAERVELVLPTFEEVFYIARHLDEIETAAEVFTSPLETLAELHDKVRLIELARRLALAVPSTAVASDRSQLRAAVARFERYLARPSFSRGGIDLLSNSGPLADERSLDECEPTEQNPWLVQEYLDGTEICSFSICRDGHIGAHAAYVHPKTIEHAGGIVFESIDDPETLRVAARLVGAIRYTGMIHLDFIRTDRGLVLLECNPRATAGLHVMSPEMLVEALLERRPSRTRVVSPGVRRVYSLALLRDMVRRWRHIPRDLKLLRSGDDVYVQGDDLLPVLYQLLSYGQVLRFRLRRGGNHREHTDLMAAYFHDLRWNGEPIP